MYTCPRNAAAHVHIIHGEAELQASVALTWFQQLRPYCSKLALQHEATVRQRRRQTKWDTTDGTACQQHLLVGAGTITWFTRHHEDTTAGHLTWNFAALPCLRKLHMTPRVTAPPGNSCSVQWLLVVVWNCENISRPVKVDTPLAL